MTDLLSPVSSIVLRMVAKKIQPPFKPSVESVLDVANFDAEFTGEKPQDSHVDETPLSETVQDQFRGFTYTGESVMTQQAAGRLTEEDEEDEGDEEGPSESSDGGPRAIGGPDRGNAGLWRLRP